MREITIIPLVEPEEVRVYQEFEEDKKQFLERNADRFFRAYRSTGSEKLHIIYKEMLRERQRC